MDWEGLLMCTYQLFYWQSHALIPSMFFRAPTAHHFLLSHHSPSDTWSHTCPPSHMGSPTLLLCSMPASSPHIGCKLLVGTISLLPHSIFLQPKTCLETQWEFSAEWKVHMRREAIIGKMEIIWARKAGRISYPSFPVAGKVKLINAKIFLPLVFGSFSSNREIQNTHLVGKERIIFPAIGIRIKD